MTNKLKKYVDFEKMPRLSPKYKNKHYEYTLILTNNEPKIKCVTVSKNILAP